MVLSFSWEAAFGLGSIVGLCIGAAAQGMASPDQSGREALQRLGDTYASCTAVVQELTSTETLESGTIIKIERTLAAADGRYGHFDLRAPAGRPSPQGAKLADFILFDGIVLRATKDGNSHVFAEYPPQPRSSDRLDPIQIMLAPWPRITSWCHALMDDPSVEVTSSGGTWTATSTRLRSSLTWNASGEILNIQVGLESEPVRVTYSYSDFVRESGVSLPQTIKVRHQIAVPGRPAVDAVLTSHLVSRTVNPGNFDELVAFDASKLRLDRFNSTTTDVVAPDGTVRYNERAVLAAFSKNDARGRLKSAALAVLAVAAVVSVLIGIRKLRRGAPR